ncbi:DeoR/GlpR family DNA-binding transcription regulator [Paramicrobacterium agarici]|uniref:DeoR family transcriptional regulator n=1 Tax=Paramicrobacterium agarici TaxID=630514 RepID=A0A2A9DUW9_9MICO|nr:DeoR/GlpR family DNA-binding transcription regulator [Microbacterium agarici]PFG29740.1 DeoR family transcriptional regulator [Microbacterium agarici]
MLTSTRHAAIVRRLHETGEASVTDLAEMLGVSTSTIRRDLNKLSTEGRLNRVRGGGSIEADEVPFQQVAQTSSGTKDRIARRAAELVVDGDVVVLDIGTTTALVARYLRGKKITLMTSSIAVLDELRDDDGIELVLAGGIVRRSYHSLVGPLAEHAFRQIQATIGFVGTSGVRSDGTVMDSTGIEVAVKHAILDSSLHKVLVADETKFPGIGLHAVCGHDRIDTLVTSETADASTRALFADAGSDVITV